MVGSSGKAHARTDEAPIDRSLMLDRSRVGRMQSVGRCDEHDDASRHRRRPTADARWAVETHGLTKRFGETSR